MLVQRLGLLMVALLLSGTAFSAGVVNVYSARHYDTDLQLYTDFETKTGIKVNLIEAASDALIERIVNEGKYSPADVLITVDAGRLYRAEQRGVFAPVQSDVLNSRVPAHLRHPEGLWFGISKRARVIIYNTEAGKPAGLNNYEDLANEAFKGQICVRSSSNIYNISLLAGLVAHHGEAQAEQWTRDVMANLLRRPQGNDTANIKAVASGECPISIVNSYYVARMIADGNPDGSAVSVLYPNQETTGTHVNISGVGVLKHAPNRANAIAFVEYLTEKKAQAFLAEGNHEYPVTEGAAVTSVIAQMGTFKEDQINASELGRNQSTAVKIFDRAGWN